MSNQDLANASISNVSDIFSCGTGELIRRPGRHEPVGDAEGCGPAVPAAARPTPLTPHPRSQIHTLRCHFPPNQVKAF